MRVLRPGALHPRFPRILGNQPGDVRGGGDGARESCADKMRRGRGPGARGRGMEALARGHQFLTIAATWGSGKILGMSTLKGKRSGYHSITPYFVVTDAV